MHSLAITEDGEVFSWGDNAFGQLGRDFGAEGDHSKPAKVMEGLKATDIAAGGCHSFVTEFTVQRDLRTYEYYDAHAQCSIPHHM